MKKSSSFLFILDEPKRLYKDQFPNSDAKSSKLQILM